MTRITFTKNIGGHTAGDTIDTAPGAAQYLIDGGYAETTKTKATKAIKKDDTTEAVGHLKDVPPTAAD